MHAGLCAPCACQYRLAGIAKYPFLFAVEQLIGRNNAVGVGRRGVDDVLGLIRSIDTNAHFIWIARVIKELRVVNAEYDGLRIRWPASPPFQVVIGYLLLQLLPENQLVYALQEDLAPGLELLILVFGFSRSHLVHRGFDVALVELADQVLAPLDKENARMLLPIKNQLS